MNVLVLFARIITYPDMCPLPILIYIHHYIFLLHDHSWRRQNNARYKGYYTWNHSTLWGILELVTNKLMLAFKTKWYNYKFWWKFKQYCKWSINKAQGTNPRYITFLVPPVSAMWQYSFCMLWIWINTYRYLNKESY